MAQKLFIIRGLPGSGKSTFAKTLLDRNPTMKHFEADMYFCQKTGEYEFDPSKLHHAHQWCWDSVAEALSEGRDVVVSNTFTQLWEMERYMAFRHHRCEVIVIEMWVMWGSVHNVPDSSISKMAARWEEIPKEMVMIDFPLGEYTANILK